jgi:hypothetical protein
MLSTMEGQDQLCLSFEEAAPKYTLISRADAKAAGLKHYFTGTPCKHGHVAQRHVPNWVCCECHKEDVKAYDRKYYQANAGAKREAQRKYRQANAETVRERKRKYRQANAEADRKYARKRYRSNTAAYIEAAAQRKRNIKHRTLWGHAEIVSLRKQCRAITKATGIPHHLDHVVPVKGKLVCGLNVPCNLRIITAAENLSKSNRFDPAAA